MITLTTPESRANATTVRLVSFTANSVIKYAQAISEVGFGTPFVVTRKVKVRFSNDDETADFTFNQLIGSVPEVAALGLAMEQEAVDRGIFDGTVA